MYVDFPDSLKEKCVAVTPRRELMAFQLVPGTVMYALGKTHIYRPHPTHRFKATLFQWEIRKFEQDFQLVHPEDAPEPIVMADEANGEKEPPAPPPEPKPEAKKEPEPEPEPVKEPEEQEGDEKEEDDLSS